MTKTTPIHLEIQTHRKNPIGVLRSSYRKDGKVRHQSHGRITGMGLDHLKLIQAAFRKEVIPAADPSALHTTNSKEYGASAALLKLAEKIGLQRTLYSRKEPWVMYALAMIAGRLVYSGSKLNLVNKWNDSAIWELVGIKDRPDVYEHCYEVMDKLLSRQKAIQKQLARKHLEESELVLYDITSSYFEGEYSSSEIVKFGYNRDKKSGHKQIVIGLICNKQGCPVAVEVFSGNTKDESTVVNKIDQLRKDFGLRKLIFVGDRGMVTQANYEKVKDIEGLNTISALTHPQILRLIEKKHIEPELFDEKNIIEVTDPDHPQRRLCLCRNNATRAKETATRETLLQKTSEALERIVKTCTERATDEKTIGIRVGRVLKQYKMGKFVNTEIVDIEVGQKKKKAKQLKWSFDQDKIETEKLIDGCYIIASDVKADSMNAEETVKAYKGLAVVEKAFRNLKTVSLDIRPVFHKTDERINAHVFICMLSYYLQWHLTEAVDKLFKEDKQFEQRRWTVEGVIERLKSIRRSDATLNGVKFDHIDTPDNEQQQILDLLGLKIN